MKSQIKNILFDLGGVLLNIDYLKTVNAFRKLGLDNPERAFTKEIQAEIFQRFECGQLSDYEFISALKQNIPGASELDITKAWNALLGDFPSYRYEMLTQLKDRYRLGVLSNTNSIHERAFMKIIDNSVGWKNFKELFVGIGYSHILGERKPNAEAFIKCMKNLDFNPKHTLFIDDTEEHVLGARKAGLNAIHLTTGEVVSLIQNDLNF